MAVSGCLGKCGVWLLLGGVLAGCPTTTNAPLKQKGERIEDPWAEIQRTAEWLHATRDFSGKRLDECVAVLEWVRGEEKCKGALCIHARDLTREWVARCPKYAAEGDVKHDDVEDLLDRYKTRAKEDPTPCGEEASSMMKNGCGKDKTCQATAEAWATRCGKSDGTPLVMRMLERTVERKGDGKRVKLDPRSCDELGAELPQALLCKDTFACEEGLKKLTVYRARCEVNGARPTALVAAYQQGILFKNNQPTPPVPVLPSAATVTPKDTPTALADGNGAVLWVCDQRVTDFDGYMKARKECENGSFVFVGILKDKGDPGARIGKLDLPSDAVLRARLPSMRVAGEAEYREKTAIAALTGDLERAAASAPADGIKALLAALKPHAAMLRRSEALRKALAARDESLAPAFRELGKAKQAATRKRIDPPMMVGFVERAQTWLLADVRDDGGVEVGATSALENVELASLLPRSTAAVVDSMKGAIRMAKVTTISGQTAKMSKAYGVSQAQACGDAFKALREAEAGMVKCALGLDTCDDARVAALGKQSDEARPRIDEARHTLRLLLTGPGRGAHDELTEAMNAVNCADPWW